MAELARHIEVGGWIMPLLGLSAWALAVVAAERALALLRLWGPVPELVDALRPMLIQGDLVGALGTAAASRGAFARVALRVLREALRDPATQEAAAAEALEPEVRGLERRLWVLPLVGSVGVLLGLLGTATGLGLGFWPVTHDATTRAVCLARALSESLNATVGGLAISVASVVLAALVTGLAKRHVSMMRAETRALLVALVTHRRALRLRLGDAVRRASVEPRGYRV